MSATNPQTIQNEEAAGEKRRPWYESKLVKRFRRSPLAVLGVIILVAYIMIAIFAPQLTHDRLGRSCMRDLGVTPTTTEQILNPTTAVFWRVTVIPPGSCFRIPRASFSPIPEPPSAEYPFGITGGGYDILYGLIWGARMAFYIGILVTGISLVLGTVIGGLAGYFGGWFDNLLMRFTDTVLAFPNLILAMVFATIFGASLTNVMVALAIVGWPTYARIMRGEILRVKEQDFVDGARALGANGLRIFFKHILPNSLASIIIVASLDIGAVVLTAAALSFLGLGAEVGFADWGQMVNFARQYIKGPPGQPFAYWYVSFYPGMAIVIFVLGWNLLGDAFRDVFDPRSHV